MTLHVETARNGSATATLDGRYLHSRHNPEREAERSLRDLARREPPCVVMKGVGLGYQLRYLVEHTEATAVIVVEPDEELLRDGLAAARLSGLMDDPRVFRAATVDELEQALVTHASGGLEVVSIPARCAADEETFGLFDAAVAAFSGRLEINRNTLLRFARVWVRNLARNLPRLAAGRSIAGLRGRFAGVPAVLLAAGPTLDQVLPHLPQLADRALLVAVDTAVSASLRARVMPDFAVVVDPQYWNTRHLDRVRASETILVSESSTHPAVFGVFEPPHYFCSSLFPLGQEIERALGPMGALGAGGSVSTTAWDFLRFLGVTEIYAAGLDLGFPDSRTHCADSYFERLAVDSAGRLKPAEGVVFRYVWDAEPHPVAAIAAPSVLSDRRMDLYRSWFIRQAAARPDVRTYVVTKGGSAIDGFVEASVEDILHSPVRRADIAAAISQIRAEGDNGLCPGVPAEARGSERSSGTRNPRVADLTTHVERLVVELHDLKSISEDALAVAQSIASQYRADGTVDFTPLAAHDARLQNHPARHLAGFLMQDALIRIAAGHGSGSIEEQISASVELYTGLVDSATFHERVLTDAIR